MARSVLRVVGRVFLFLLIGVFPLPILYVVLWEAVFRGSALVLQATSFVSEHGGSPYLMSVLDHFVDSVCAPLFQVLFVGLSLAWIGYVLVKVLQRGRRGMLTEAA